MIPFVILAIENDSDRDFMEKLYLEYNLHMYSEAKNIVESQWDAEEIVQTVVEKLINHISKLRGMTRECRVNYIITAVINCALSQKARDKRISFVDIEDEFTSDVDDGFDMDDRLIDQSNKDILYAAWRNLGQKTKWFLSEKYVLEKSNDEIARDAGIQPDSVRVMLARARNALRKEFFKLSRD